MRRDVAKEMSHRLHLAVLAQDRAAEAYSRAATAFGQARLRVQELTEALRDLKPEGRGEAREESEPCP